MAERPENVVPDDVAGEMEALVQGRGPFTGPLSDAEQKRLEQLESSQTEEVDAAEVDRLEQERIRTQERLDTLEQYILSGTLAVQKPILLPDQNAEFGTNAAAFSGPATTISITPCDRAGVATGEDAVSVFLRADRSSATVTIAKDSVLTWLRFDTRTDAGVAGVLVGDLKNDDSSYMIPSGVIVMWSGAVVNIPTGWSLCDGGGDPARPDLRGRFVVGSFASSGVQDGGGAGDLGETNDYAAPGETGGKSWHGQTENNHGDHIDHMHLIPDQSVQSGYGVMVSDATDSITSRQVKQAISGYFKQRHGGGADGINAWVAQNPVDEAHSYADTDNRPCWYSVAYIIKD